MVVRSIPALVALAVGLSAATARASCFDGVRDGPESDVDCGGDCPPCERGDTCRVPRDCYSGLCAASVCREHLREGDEPVPRGYALEPSDADGPAIARTIGWASLGAGYVGGYLAALTLPGELTWLYVPVIGPWAKVFDEDQSYRGLIALDGLFQTVGAGLVVGGLAMGGQQFVRGEAVHAKVQVTPIATTRGGGLWLLGAF